MAESARSSLTFAESLRQLAGGSQKYTSRILKITFLKSGHFRNENEIPTTCLQPINVYTEIVGKLGVSRQSCELNIFRSFLKNHYDSKYYRGYPDVKNSISTIPNIERFQNSVDYPNIPI